MSLHLTPETIEAQYEALRTTKPFSAWGLSDPDDLEFCVLATRDRLGHFRGAKTGHHEIGISMRRVGTLDTLIRVLAHEMIHLYQELTGTTTGKTEHNAEFRRIAAEVARHHCFDPKEL
jgi:hypothetical protein